MAVIDLKTGDPVEGEAVSVETAQAGPGGPSMTEATIETPRMQGRVIDLNTGDPVADAPPEKPKLDIDAFRKRIYAETAKDTDFMDALNIAIGRGVQTVGQGLGFLDEPPKTQIQAYEALEEERPVTTGAGEIVGQALPFIPAAVATGGIAPLGGRIAASTALGALEGGAIARGEGQDIGRGAGIGAAVGAGSEILFPVIGRLGRRVFEQVTGRTPKGRLFDAQGNPVPEMQEAMEQAGMTMDDLTADAAQILKENVEGADPEQVAKAARFAQEGVQPTRAEAMTTGKFQQQATEQRLLQSGQDPLAEPFRQYKLQQSEQIKTALGKVLDYESIPEETGNTIIQALTDRKQLLRTQKNDLYRQAAEAAEDLGGVPVFTDSMADAIPKGETWETLSVTAPSQMKRLDDLLMMYGIKDPTQQMIESGFQPRILSLKNFDTLRQSLNGLAREDMTGAAEVAINPIRKALDMEVDELGETLASKGFPEEVIKPVKQARATVRQMKKEFSPQNLVGQLVGTKRDKDTPIIEASKVYNKLMARSQPVENVRRTVNSLLKAGTAGEQGLKNLQMTTLMDLVNAGYSTASRTIDGVPVFNPGAFRKQINQIGKDKLSAIFKNNRPGLAKINNIEAIAKDIQPSADAIPKGSAPVLMDLMDRLGIASISQAAPGAGGAIWEVVKRMTGGIGQRKAVSRAMTPQIEQTRYLLDETFPGMAAALGVSAWPKQEEAE